MSYPLPGPSSRLLRARGPVLSALLLASLLSPALAQTPNTSEPAEQLPTFTVDSTRDVGYQATNTTSVGYINRPLKDLPQSIGILNQELLRDVGALDFAQAVQYSTNINFQIANADTNFTIRGLTSRSFFVNFLTRVTPTDSYMTERIEVVHGPASVIYGQQDAGGVVNTITKIAHLKQNRTTVELTGGDYDLRRGTFDTNIALGDHQALRVAGLYHSTEDGRAYAGIERRGLYADYLWQINPTTSIRITGESGYDHRTPFTGIITLPLNSSAQSAAAAVGLLPQKYAQSIYGPDAQSNLDYFFYTAAFTKALFNDRLNVQFTVSESMRNRNQRWGPAMKSASYATAAVGPSSINGYQITPGYAAGTPIFTQNWQLVGLDERFRFYRLQAAWELPELGGKHMLTFGGNYQPNDYPTYNTVSWLYRNPDGSPRGAIFGTSAADRMPYTVIMDGGLRYPQQLIGNGLYERKASGFQLGQIVKAGFAMLASDWGHDGRFKTLIGFRYDDMYNSNDTLGASGNTDNMIITTSAADHAKVWSKSIGAIYALTPTLNLTANYGTSLWPNVNRFDINLNLMPPTEGESYEFGLKALTPDNRYSASFTYFDLTQKNSALSVAAPLLIAQFGSSTPARAVAGAMESKGYELEFTANPTPAWTLRAGVGFADPKITTDLPQFGYPGGKTMPGVTKYTGTFFTRYNFTTGPVRGLFVGGGFNYRSENYAGYVDTNNDNIAEQQVTFPGYTTFDFLAGYSFRLARHSRLTLRINLRNAFDKSYIVATDVNFAGYGDRRQLMFSTSLEF
ncbi:TonB-dependent receptor [Horticoccus luteus]|uniref:TonB-dependent receptor n=1 Tax=Horticoccus luteus TaxID=2862869 RepID=A0A8F9XKW4_9BACT|nr:TonB-dependent receptor plug domain-containing protein [Horticoccus luteus]QYM78611.1 TonB-dependent receptor [Horticoccus luteus]